MLESFYKDSIVLLEGVIAEIIARLEIIRKYKIVHNDRDPIEYITSRVKSEESMKEKLKRKNLQVNLETALTKIYDAAGIRIICEYIDDVYSVVKMLKKFKDLKILQEKDYIKNPKENGYRSYHLIVEITAPYEDILGNNPGKFFAEIQVRTIAMDSWASLEHQMKYKHDIKNPELIVKELKRCADELAACDVSMQTIRNLINAEN